ncbi:hypothetical protein [Mycobacterium haemophilum]|uniref:hypothetical protein n=1 Tax=Mycobacterium haemophilum TaxID=29311 RepID=UPI001E48CA40|nr:hypothetical protein [Mycobacterium haemophilum]
MSRSPRSGTGRAVPLRGEGQPKAPGSRGGPAAGMALGSGDSRGAAACISVHATRSWSGWVSGVAFFGCV